MASTPFFVYYIVNPFCRLWAKIKYFLLCKIAVLIPFFHNLSSYIFLFHRHRVIQALNLNGVKKTTSKKVLE